MGGWLVSKMFSGVWEDGGVSEILLIPGDNKVLYACWGWVGSSGYLSSSNFSDNIGLIKWVLIVSELRFNSSANLLTVKYLSEQSLRIVFLINSGLTRFFSRTGVAISSKNKFSSLCTELGSLCTELDSLCTELGSLRTELGSLCTELGSLCSELGSSESKSDWPLFGRAYWDTQMKDFAT